MIFHFLSCISCNKLIRDGIYNSASYLNLLKILSAFFVLAAIVALLAYISFKRYRISQQPGGSSYALSPVRLLCAGLVLGIGLGGFADGIVLHQLLQWHEMLSAKIPPTDYVGKSINMFWDGAFHSFCFAVVLIGITMLWLAAASPEVVKSGRVLIGSMLAGWGIFNIVEGLINHHWLKLHNVIEYSIDHYRGNLLFLIFSLLILFLGSWLAMKPIRKRIVVAKP